MIRLGTLFSGIGAIEQALILMSIDHVNVFACDNGELELKLMPGEKQKEYDKLKKIARYRITAEEKKRLAELIHAEQKIIEDYAQRVAELPTKAEKKNFVDNLYNEFAQGENLVKQTYLANYIIDEKDFHLDFRFFDCRIYAN